MSDEVVRYRPELRPDVVALYSHLVGPDPALNDAYFRWKHEQNPYTDEPVVYVALADGEVAGMRGFLGAHWQLGASGATARWRCACDLVVDPAHRGAGLFRRIMAFALADLAEREPPQPVLNWSANPITYGASLRSGWRLLAPYAPWSRRTARTRIARAVDERIRHWPVAWRFADVAARLALHRGFDALEHGWSAREHPAAMMLVDEARADAMAALVRGARSPRVGHVRDATYYRWRFRNPLCDYRFLYWYEPDLRGFLVLQLARRGDAADINVVDWEAATPELLDAMIAALVAIPGYDALSVWTATLPPNARTTLLRHEFGPFDDSRGDPAYRPGLLAIGPGGSDVRDAGAGETSLLSSAESWQFRMAYSDFY